MLIRGEKIKTKGKLHYIINSGKRETNLTYNLFIKFITSIFFIGYLPLIPGTFGSIAGLFVYVLLKGHFLVLINSLIMILGFLLAGRAAKLFNRPDPPQVVIDELNGMLICFIGLPTAGVGQPFDKLILMVGLVIFRVLDVIKPYPADRLHRREGSLGIMGDDIVAGIYTNLILRIILYFF